MPVALCLFKALEVKSRTPREMCLLTSTSDGENPSAIGRIRATDTRHGHSTRTVKKRAAVGRRVKRRRKMTSGLQTRISVYPQNGQLDQLDSGATVVSTRRQLANAGWRVARIQPARDRQGAYRRNTTVQRYDRLAGEKPHPCSQNPIRMGRMESGIIRTGALSPRRRKMLVNINIVKGENEIADFELPMSDVHSFLDLIKRLGWYDSDGDTHYRVSEIQLTSQ